jgi:GT2 family glycosyltransferase
VRSRGGRVRYEPSVEMYHFENVTTDASPDLNFKYLTVKHGLLFKQRWRHMFERERGPSSDTLRWRELPRRGIEDVGTPPLI